MSECTDPASSVMSCPPAPHPSSLARTYPMICCAMHVQDEFYFEHHVLHSPMGRSWTRGSGPALQQTLSDSYALFTRLRELGVRAHSWV